MKVNVVFLVIALAIAGLIGYAFYSTNKGEANCVLLAIGSGCMIAASLSSSLAVSFKGRGGTGNIKIVSVLFLLVFLISNIVFGFTGVSVPAYIIVNGLLLLVYILIVYSLYRATK